ncbi:MAG: ribonuclease III [Lachnospiraceae bacterium]|nr:ribonuclease III [Lachnospiraceae bacterium]
MESIKKLEAIISYHFKDSSLLERAMTHSSYAHEREESQIKDNERLEFLGDAVLEIVVSDYLYKHFTKKTEGDLTKLRASLVCEPTLAFCAREISLGKFLRLSHGENANGGRERNSILSDAFEALIGAIYLDGGLSCAGAFVEERLLSDIDQKQLFFDSKTKLQERTQGSGMGEISYEMLRVEGPDHARRYTAQVLIGSKAMGVGTGTSKKAAEQEAAREALLQLGLYAPEADAASGSDKTER